MRRAADSGRVESEPVVQAQAELEPVAQAQDA